MHFLPFVLLALSLAACDIVEPGDTPPPPPAIHPYGAGNGKVIFLSDLAAAERIDVMLAGEPIGAVTRFVGCPSQVTTDDSLAVAIRPAGNYQYTAQSATGLGWSASTVQIREDVVTRRVLVGRPSMYEFHAPGEIEGMPVFPSGANADYFASTVTAPFAARIEISPPGVVQGDRFDLVVNGAFVVRGGLIGTAGYVHTPALRPGSNYVALRLSHDVGDDGTSAEIRFVDGSPLTLSVSLSGWRASRQWEGFNVRYAC